MNRIRSLTLLECEELADDVANHIHHNLGRGHHKLYGVPRGGIVPAYQVAQRLESASIVQNASEATIFIDDIIDSGITKKKYFDNYFKPFFALVDKGKGKYLNDPTWYIFPWEGTEESSIEDNFRRLIQFAGDDPTRPGMLETPTRAAKAWKEWFVGYSQDVNLKVFEDDALAACSGAIIVRGIEYYSHCEHHMAPFFGEVNVGYIAKGKVIGLSKLPRVVDKFARRFQTQERIAEQVAEEIWKTNETDGVIVFITGRHMCACSRGVNKQKMDMTYCAIRGKYERPEVRAEFFASLEHK